VSQFHDFLEKITWWDDPQTGQLSPAERAAIAEEAARWFVVHDETGMRERAEFLTWARRSPHHLTAYVDTAKIDAELKNAIKPFSAVALEQATFWDTVARHPLATIVTVILGTAGVVWTASYNLRVEPAAQQIKILEEQVAILKSQLAAVEKHTKQPGD